MTRECNTGRQSLLMDIQKVDFMLVDLNLFLDTHPEDREALRFYHEMNAQRQKAVAEYTAEYGPLTAGSVTNAERWTWVDSPWPWQKEG